MENYLWVPVINKTKLFQVPKLKDLGINLAFCVYTNPDEDLRDMKRLLWRSGGLNLIMEDDGP